MKSSSISVSTQVSDITGRQCFGARCQALEQVGIFLS